MKAIICDDDEVILKGLKSVIDWEKLGVEIAGTAGDGRTALKLLQELKPQLLMTDIRMPHVDGLELIEEGKRLNPDLMAIVFSGYDDFSYARRALKLGVYDYLTKPIHVEELESLVDLSVRNYRLAKKETFFEREDLLRKLLMDEGSENYRTKGMEKQFCGVMILETSDTDSMAEVCELLRKEEVYILAQERNRCEAAVVAPSKLGIELKTGHLIAMVRKLFEEKGVAMTSAVSSVWNDIRQIRNCHKEAMDALKLKYIMGENQNLKYEEARGHLKKELPDMLPNMDLISSVKNGDMDRLEKQIMKLEEDLQNMGLGSYLYLQYMVGNLYSTVIKELESAGISANLVFHNPVDEYKKLIRCDTIKKAIAVLGENLKRICEYVIIQQSGVYSKPVCQALKYIAEHYNCPGLSKDEVAKAAGISGGHFSTIFRNETGATFTDYLVKFRMEKAIELMKDPNRKIYEIAMMVGYENIPYFSTAFKKYTKCSPSEYRASTK